MFSKIQKSLFLLLVNLLSLNLMAQIEINQSHMPSANDTIRYSIVNTSTLDFSKTGANYTWNFSSLDPQSQAIYSYKNSTNTPYILNFGFSALGLKIADSLGSGQFKTTDVYQFFKKSSTKWEGIGTGFRLSGGFPQAGKNASGKTDVIYTFPMNYNDKDSCDFELKIPLVITILPIGNWFQNGTRHNTVDGWGKISTPYVSNVNCLRIKSVINQFDSIAVTTPTVFNFGFKSKRIEYKWLSISEKIPILEVTGNETNGVFTITNIRYRDQYRNIINVLAPVSEFSANKTNTIKYDSIQFSDLSTQNPTSYSWTITPNTGIKYLSATSSSSKNPKIQFNAIGTYQISLTTNNFFGSNTKTKANYINIGPNLSILKLENTLDVKVIPNPSSNLIKIDGLKENTSYEITILNTLGQVVISLNNLDSKQNSINIANLNSGKYFLLVKTQDIEQKVTFEKY